MNFEQAKIILIDLHLDSASFHKNDIVDKAAYLFSLFEADFVLAGLSCCIYHGFVYSSITSPT